MDLAQATCQLRLSLGLTQQAFAQRLGVSLRAIANYESGRPPNAASLQRLTKLAREAGRTDLAVLFSAKSRQVDHEELDREAAQQKTWTEALVALLQSKDDKLWLPVARSILNALERLSQQPLYAKDEAFATTLVEARYRLADGAERKLRELAKDRQSKTGEGYYQAYSAVLLDNPRLYEQYLEQRARAARGTIFEKSLASPSARKS